MKHKDWKPLVRLQDWSALGECTTREFDGNPFFDFDGAEDVRRTVCARCEVSWECLSHAINHGEVDGIWGGMYPVERQGFARNNPELNTLARRRHNAHMRKLS